MVRGGPALTDYEFEKRTRANVGWCGIRSLHFASTSLAVLGMKRKDTVRTLVPHALKLLAAAEILRGTAFDIFGTHKHATRSGDSLPGIAILSSRC